MSKKHSVINFLIGFLTTTFVFIFLFFTLCFYNSAKSKEINESFVISMIATLIMMAIYLYMVYELRCVVMNVSKGRVFSRLNIKKVKSIGKMIFISGILETIFNYRVNKDGIVLFATANGGIKPTIFIYIILGSLAFVIAEAFKEAAEIKEDSNLTI